MTLVTTLLHRKDHNVFLRPLLVILLLGAMPVLAEPRLLVMGDSLSAAYGMDAAKGWVALLNGRLQDDWPEAEVTNGSISGETTAGGLARLPKLLQQAQPQLVVLELGANDGLRGYPLREMRNNLRRAIEMSREAGAEVLLLGMQIPPNYGPRYSNQFQQTYSELAEELEVPLVPFFLDGVAGDPELNQADGMHPTAPAQPRLLENIWPYVEQWLELI
ncbi:arylesterase [Pseudomaricurvus sp. HS19]|uniref:arylesterase n=1 Tax=Pseudomaricurvus sp. HS19 TaxID=2692626 RepID=UPI0013A8AFC0|nr:arylesterase [Pseudomaricurvus sp. HS19]MYM62918.1 arylesterase [Pseudomaricurvus sp. HS19]